ncbi:MAG: SHOCT domain-containing protein, partial [Woeseia sp.]
DGSAGECELTNKRGAWTAEIPATISVRKSDDALKYQCETKDGRRAVGSIESEMGAKIVASAVFLDLGITDAITDKHRRYTASFVIPVPPKEGESENSTDSSTDSDSAGPTEGRNDVYEDLETLNDLRDRGIITDAEFEAEKKRLLEGN